MTPPASTKKRNACIVGKLSARAIPRQNLIRAFTCCARGDAALASGRRARRNAQRPCRYLLCVIEPAPALAREQAAVAVLAAIAAGRGVCGLHQLALVLHAR